MADLVLQHVQRTFSDVVAVDDLTVEVADGELVCLLGPSGCGKTTTLRMIAGLEYPDSGQIFLGGREATYLEPRRRRVGMMFQGYALYPHLSVLDNIAYPLKVRGIDRAERMRRVQEVATLVDIGALLGRRVNQISGGQQQRVALARAIVQDPQIFLLDEPISNLDAQLRSTMRLEIKRLQRKVGRSMVVVAHDQLDALTMADHIAIMRAGRLQQYGTPDEIYRRPVNTFVASFVGEPTMNLLPGQLERVDGGYVVRGDGFCAPVPAQMAGQVDGARVTLGIRPQDVRLVNAEGIAASVDVVAPEGSDIVYDLRLGRHNIKLKTSTDIVLHPGQPVQVRFPIAHVHLFQEDGTRVQQRSDAGLGEEVRIGMPQCDQG